MASNPRTDVGREPEIASSPVIAIDRKITMCQRRASLPSGIRLGWCVLVVSVGLGASTLSGAQTRRVGNDAACTHSSLQAAIDSVPVSTSGITEIAIASNQAYSAQALTIQNRRVLLRGGYANCGTVSATPGARTPLSGAGNGGQPVLRVIQGNTNTGLVQLEALDITGANHDGDGGGVYASGPMQLDFVGVRLRENRAGRGGGLFVQGMAGQAPTAISLTSPSAIFASHIENNTAISGGGAYLDASANVVISLILGDDASIRRNQASEDGGGVSARGDGASVAMRGPSLDAADSEHGIFANQAARDGGGAYLSNRAVLVSSQFGNNLPPQIAQNGAGRDGGGIVLNSATALLRQTFVRDNVAGASQPGRGGGFYLLGTSFAVLRGAPNETAPDHPCRTNLPCAALSGNRAGSGAHAGIGGAAHVTAPAKISISQAAVQGNQADDAALALLTGEKADLDLRGALISAHAGNGALIVARDRARLTLVGTTLAENLQIGPALRLENVSLDARGSILDGGTSTVVQSVGTNTLETRCVIASENFHASGDVRVQDPRLLDPAAGNFSLTSDSPALDACDNFGDVPVDAYDLDGRARGVDLPALADLGGPFDIGALERPSPEAIFRDGFE
jgi:hypothetical protein